MDVSQITHCIKVFGDQDYGGFACFSRPEMKVERFSYPCPTPSAARGIFEAIYWKPQFYWQIDKVEILNKPDFIALRRNEVGSVISVRNVTGWMRGATEPIPLMADESSQREQRQTMALRCPKYLIYGHIVPRLEYKKEIIAYNSQFVRRAKDGKCIMQPCFGCREFVAYFEYVQEDELKNRASDMIPVNYSHDIGFMLYDVFDLRTKNNEHSKPFISMFKAEIRNGVLEIPPYESELVLKPEPEIRRTGNAS